MIGGTDFLSALGFLEIEGSLVWIESDSITLATLVAANDLLKSHLDMVLVSSELSERPSFGKSYQRTLKGVQSVCFLTWNVWFREDLEIVARMKAIGEAIALKKPHFVALQEVTANILQILRTMEVHFHIPSPFQLVLFPNPTLHLSIIE